jgi:hypothetical protein
MSALRDDACLLQNLGLETVGGTSAQSRRDWSVWGLLGEQLWIDRSGWPAPSQAVPQAKGGLRVKLTLTWGILAIVFMVLSFIPCLDCLEWPSILFASIGVAFCGIGLAKAKGSDRMAPAIGIGCCAFAVLLLIIHMSMSKPVLIYHTWP